MKSDALVDALLGRTIPPAILPGSLPRQYGSFVEDLELDQDDYPSERALEGISTTGMQQAQRWMRDKFADLADSILYSSVTREDANGKRRIRFATGGWSGCEDVINAVTSNWALRQYVVEHHSGGLYIIEVPLETPS